ncbi:MAG: hypothetical protein ACXVLQ_06285 [Bacteriovorax sp.]
MKFLKAFAAGFLSTLLFHQGLLFILNRAGLIPVVPYNFKPTPPFGVPSVISLAFFGGLWGILLWSVTSKDQGSRLWLKSLLFGSFAPTFVAMAIVFPLKGLDVTLPKVLMGLIVNAFWGIGSSLLIQMKLPHNPFIRSRDKSISQ